MQFSDTTNDSGIVQETDWILDTDSTSYPLPDKARRANSWLERVADVIMRADNNWEWDDSNQTDLPRVTTSLEADRQDYGINTAFLKIRRIECKDENGEWKELININEKDINQALPEFHETAGTPIYYDLEGNHIYLYPKPSYASSGGMRIYYQRNVVKFSADGSDTTKTPGFNPQFHQIIPSGMSYDYGFKEGYSQKFLNILLKQIGSVEERDPYYGGYMLAIQNFYANRDRDRRKRMHLARENYGEEGGTQGRHPDRFYIG